MIAGIIASLVLGLIVMGVVVAPLLHKDAAISEQRSASLSEARELRSRYEMLLASIKDLEDDRATDKIGDEDYERLHAQLSREVIDLMHRMDAQDAERAAESERGAPRPVLHRGGKSSESPT